MQAKILRNLLKRPQTAHEIAARIDPAMNVRALSRALGYLAREGKLVVHAGRPARYAKS